MCHGFSNWGCAKEVGNMSFPNASLDIDHRGCSVGWDSHGSFSWGLETKERNVGFGALYRSQTSITLRLRAIHTQ